MTARLAVSNLAWAPGQTTQALALSARHGAAGVEAAPTRIAPWDRLGAAAVGEYRRRVEKAGLRVSSLQAVLFGRPDAQLLADDGAFRSLADHLRLAAEVAQGLGAGVAVLGAPRNRLRGTRPVADAEALAAERLRRLGDIAQPADLVIGLEPVPARYGADFMLRAADVRRVVALLCAHPAVQAHLDTACAAGSGDAIGAEIKATGAGLAHFHIAEPDLGPFDAPACSHGEATALAGFGYAGWVAVEMREQPDGLRAVETARRFARRAYG